VALRIDHCQRRWKLCPWLVMIRDDQIEPERARVCSGLYSSNAAVDRDDKMHPLGREAIERRRLQSITIPQTLGDEMDDVGVAK
jgi:hypothetical protein